VSRSGLSILLFPEGQTIEESLDHQPADAAGPWLKFPKKSASKRGLTKTEAIDSAAASFNRN
jgi:hypothetical protein